MPISNNRKNSIKNSKYFKGSKRVNTNTKKSLMYIRRKSFEYKEVITLLNTIFKADNEAYKKQRIERIMYIIPEPARLNVNNFKIYFKMLNGMNLRGVELLDFIDIEQYYIQKEVEEKVEEKKN